MKSEQIRAEETPVVHKLKRQKRQEERVYVDLKSEENRSGTEAQTLCRSCRSDGTNQNSESVNHGAARAAEPPQRGAEKSEPEAERKTGLRTMRDQQTLEDPPLCSAADKRSSITAEDSGARGFTHREEFKPEERSGGTEEEEEEQDYDEDDEDDDVTLVLSDELHAPEDESHYISTREIQLCELSDREDDCACSSASGDTEDLDLHVCSFVDYGDGQQARAQGAAALSSARETDPRAQQIHLSISASSRAINEPSGLRARRNILYDGTRADMSRCVMAAPGRVHSGLSSGSSALSEGDDADREVRNLTARAFRSLAQPHFIQLSSSDSSASERALSSWTALVDLKYGNMSQPGVSRHRHADSKEGVLSARSQQIELRLTETLNFRCNVTAAAAERRAESNQSPADEVTVSSARSRREARVMEETHKKNMFASSLLKNVLSKKIQEETERRMERGEIQEPRPPHLQHLPPPSSAASDSSRVKGAPESRAHSRSSSELLMSLEELADLVDSGSGVDSCRSSESRRLDAAESCSERSGAEAEAKKGALAACRSTLLRSQNSAFRCWRDETQLEFQSEQKRQESTQEQQEREEQQEQPRASGGTLLKMSHLFVPSFQLQSGAEELKLSSDNSVIITESRSEAPTKSPEIKINLRSVRDGNAARLRAASTSRPEEGKIPALSAALRGECADKVPHFTVRDFRESKGKLQTPIHQVRDVRKLVKSSYHFVSLDNSENKTSNSEAEAKKQLTCRNPSSVSPIIIKCQSVNTNSSGKLQPNNQMINNQLTNNQQVSKVDSDRLSPEITAARAGGLTLSSEGGLKPPRQQEKPAEASEKKPESKMANLVALEKLQAAVKTMEQLYVFERNEWKRKNEPTQLTDSHVLSVISSTEHPEDHDTRLAQDDRTVRRDSNEEKTPLTSVVASPSLLRREDKLLTRSTQAVPSTSIDTGIKNTFSLSSSFKSAQTAKTQQTAAPNQTAFNAKSFTPKSPKLPVSLKSSRTKPSANERVESRDAETFLQDLLIPDNENYLTIPAKSPAGNNQSDPACMYTFTAQPQTTTPPGLIKSGVRATTPPGQIRAGVRATTPPGQIRAGLRVTTPPGQVRAGLRVTTPPGQVRAGVRVTTPPGQVRAGLRATTPPGAPGSAARIQDYRAQSPKRASIVMETRSPEVPSASIYHSVPFGMTANQPQMFCFSPAITPAPAVDPFAATHRKMLLDPTTGNYYLVDTPMTPATKRLFDPETGQYVDVPLPQPPITPVPMAMSPLALSPGAYGHAYMIYPGFMSSPPVIPARSLVPTQVSLQAAADGEERAPQQPEGLYMESPFYMATEKSSQHAAAASRPPLHAMSHAKQPVISITTNQGPRIIAPPSFDGTTMSFVVEHR